MIRNPGIISVHMENAIVYQSDSEPAKNGAHTPDCWSNWNGAMSRNGGTVDKIATHQPHNRPQMT